VFSLSLNSINGGDVDLRQHFQRVDMKKKKKDARHVKSEKCEWKRRRKKDERASIINDNGRLRRCRE
jgi:hypothetical protein